MQDSSPSTALSKIDLHAEWQCSVRFARQCWSDFVLGSREYPDMAEQFYARYLEAAREARRLDRTWQTAV